MNPLLLVLLLSAAPLGMAALLLCFIWFVDVFGRAADDQATTHNDWQTYDE